MPLFIYQIYIILTLTFHTLANNYYCIEQRTMEEVN